MYAYFNIQNTIRFNITFSQQIHARLGGSFLYFNLMFFDYLFWEKMFSLNRILKVARWKTLISVHQNRHHIDSPILDLYVVFFGWKEIGQMKGLPQVVIKGKGSSLWFSAQDLRRMSRIQNVPKLKSPLSKNISPTSCHNDHCDDGADYHDDDNLRWCCVGYSLRHRTPVVLTWPASAGCHVSMNSSSKQIICTTFRFKW